MKAHALSNQTLSAISWTTSWPAGRPAERNGCGGDSSHGFSAWPIWLRNVRAVRLQKTLLPVLFSQDVGLPSSTRGSVIMASSLVLASLWATVAIAQRPGHAPYQHAGLFDHPNPTAGQPSRYQDWSNGDPSDAQKHWGVENFSGFTKDAENCLSELGTIQAGTLPQFKTDNVSALARPGRRKTGLTIR